MGDKKTEEQKDLEMFRKIEEDLKTTIRITILTPEKEREKDANCSQNQQVRSANH